MMKKTLEIKCDMKIPYDASFSWAKTTVNPYVTRQELKRELPKNILLLTYLKRGFIAEKLMARVDKK